MSELREYLDKITDDDLINPDHSVHLDNLDSLSNFRQEFHLPCKRGQSRTAISRKLIWQQMLRSPTSVAIHSV